jgi:hypothetical protein
MYTSDLKRDVIELFHFTEVKRIDEAITAKVADRTRAVVDDWKPV